MKFRHFEFRLFPKLRSKKKKRQGKLCNYDFPRDIGLDKNCNYSANSSYDNYGVDTKSADTTNNDFVYHRMNSFATCYERLGRNELLNSTYETPLPEIRINVDTLCRCSQCEYNYTQSKGEYGPYSEIYSAHAHNKSPVWKELDISSSFLDCREDVPSLYFLPMSTNYKLDVTFDDTVTNNMQTSIDTGYASECKESDSECMSTRDDLDTTNDHTSDIDLEWDNEPTTQILILDSP
ncbi:hypothetical protein MAR_031009, partial [Mya arenaria]